LTESAQRLGRVSAAFDNEVGLPCQGLVRRQAMGKTDFNPGKMFSSPANLPKQIQLGVQGSKG